MNSPPGVSRPVWVSSSFSSVVRGIAAQPPSSLSARGVKFYKERSGGVRMAVARLRPTPNVSGEEVVAQLERARVNDTIELGGERLRVSSLNKVLWPATEATPAFTKRDLLIYL